MLQHIDRVATPEACAKKLSQILANNTDNRGGDWSQNLCEVLVGTSGQN